MAPHTFTCTVTWTGNRGAGTTAYAAYGRDHLIEMAGKPPIAGSAVPEFRGDAGRHNPEDLLVAALSTCHMLWYLHLCADAGVVVTAYRDTPRGVMRINPDGSGEFTSATLHPSVTIANDSDASKAAALHESAHEMCFIARSLNFHVTCEPDIRTA